jgi:hypothetical protein
MMSCGEVETTLPSQELNSCERLDNLVQLSHWGRAWHVDASGVTLLDCAAAAGPWCDQERAVIGPFQPQMDQITFHGHRATEHPFQPWSWLSALHSDKGL